MYYTLTEGVTVPQNTVKASILNGTRILDRAFSRGEFSSLQRDQFIDHAIKLVRNQLDHVVASIEGDYSDKGDLVERLELYLVDRMISK